MNQERYQLRSGENSTLFEFVSRGPKGNILKIIQFSPTKYKNIFNLGFGDKHPETGEIDDLAISDNKDTEKILATVAASVYMFTDAYPDSWIYATGSTEARTRLYRIALTKYLTEAETDFQIFGQVGDDWEPFEKRKNYEAFAVKRK
jgi:hypothetical protein